MTRDTQAPFAIAVAPNGARRSKADHPRLPMTAGEIARDAAEALEAGAAMIHLHVRDSEGRHTLDADLYREATAAVRAAVGSRMLVQVTTEAVGRYGPAEQMGVVDALHPESVSIALREILPEPAGDEAAVARFLERTSAAETLVQLIIYDASELTRIGRVAARGILPEPLPPVLAVLGRYSGAGATEAELDAYLAAGIGRFPWMLCAFGPGEARFAAEAAAHGGDARVGFENNLWLPGGALAPGNAALVVAAAAAASRSGRRLATADDLRHRWRAPVKISAVGATDLD
jgi:3-keto-5-aminohexanoate cleavage enzyme